MNIRKANPSDFSDLMELSRNFKTSPYSFDRRFTALSPTFFPAFAQDMIYSGASISIIAEENAETIGFCTFGVNSKLSEVINKKTGNILLLAVDESFRGRGAGKTLVQKSCGLLKSMGTEIITVGTDIYNYPAIRVYEACGFRFKMSWHILRYYPQSHNENAVLDRIEPYRSGTLDEFCSGFSRPISLLKEETIDPAGLNDYLTQNFKNGIAKGNSICLQYFENNSPAGLINIGRDEIGQKTLGLELPIYKILDLIVLSDWKGRGIEQALFLDAANRLGKYALMEIWVNAENSDLIQAAEDSGFRLSYTGVSFHAIP
jgi:ribosomal protein S18 acetylase RimI-like enzyme